MSETDDVKMSVIQNCTKYLEVISFRVLYTCNELSEVCETVTVLLLQTLGCWDVSRVMLSHLVSGS